MPHEETPFDKLAAAREQIVQLRRALGIYGGHIPPCPGRPCECGFAAAWTAAGLPSTFASVLDPALENIELKRRIASLLPDNRGCPLCAPDPRDSSHFCGFHRG